ncbi:MAG: NHL repeat-containing protein [Candidatus Coatesbacteria bacterium]|nr:MAG: NHL repeat-containing protein [Candidatus Coatesbacteria bacterium]
MLSRRLTYCVGFFFLAAGFTACEVGDAQLDNPAWGTCWVADADGGAVMRIAPAGDEIGAANYEMGTPAAVLADPYNDVCWVADGAGRVVLLSNRANVQKTLYGFENPTALGLFPKESSVWVLDAGLKRLTKINSEGAVEREYGDLTAPSALACDPITGDAYVVDGNKIVRVNRKGQLVREFAGFSAPADIAFDANTEKLWICDTGNDRLVKIDRDGTVKLVFADPGFKSPVLIDVDVETGVVYAVDGVQGYIVKVNTDGELLLYDTGEYNPIDIAFNNYSEGSVWVADAEGRRVVKLNADLEYLDHVGGFFDPVALAPMAEPR